MASSRTLTETRVDWLDAGALHAAPARPWRVQGDDLPETEGDDDDLEDDDDEEDEEDDEDEELDEDEEKDEEEEEEDEEADDLEARRPRPR
jgi:hypothetical protein